MDGKYQPRADLPLFSQEEIEKMKKIFEQFLINYGNICTCNYPTEIYRNGSGHHPDCPAHKRFCELHGWPLPGLKDKDDE